MPPRPTEAPARAFTWASILDDNGGHRSLVLTLQAAAQASTVPRMRRPSPKCRGRAGYGIWRLRTAARRPKGCARTGFRRSWRGKRVTLFGASARMPLRGLYGSIFCPHGRTRFYHVRRRPRGGALRLHALLRRSAVHWLNSGTASPPDAEFRPADGPRPRTLPLSKKRVKSSPWAGIGRYGPW